MNTQQLRLNGYSVDSAGHIECHRKRENAPHGYGCERYAHERCAIIRVELSRDTREGRALVDAVIAAVDEPRALSGRDRKDGACLLFRCDKAVNGKRHELALRDGTEVTITFGSEGLTVDPDAFTWAKGRSPADVARDALPPLFDDHAETALAAAFKHGAVWVEQYETERAADKRLAELRAAVDRGEIKLHETEIERMQREDERLIAAHEGQELVQSDGILQSLVVAARQRFARRKAETA